MGCSTMMGCFRPVFRWLKSPFHRKREERILEIGPPTNFRKEEFTMPLSDSETLTDHHDSPGFLAEKEGAESAVQRKASKRDKLKQHVQRLGAKLTA